MKKRDFMYNAEKLCYKIINSNIDRVQFHIKYQFHIKKEQLIDKIILLHYLII